MKRRVYDVIFGAIMRQDDNGRISIGSVSLQLTCGHVVPWRGDMDTAMRKMDREVRCLKCEKRKEAAG